MLRALLTQLGLDKDAAAVRVPSYRLGPPETLTAVQYGNLIGALDKRTLLANATTRCCGCSATTGCATPSCAG